MEIKPHIPDRALSLLHAAIDSINDPNDSACLPSEFSTENREILEAVSKGDYVVRTYEILEEDDRQTHDFVLEQKSSGLLISANVLAANDKCVTYSFARIVSEK